MGNKSKGLENLRGAAPPATSGSAAADNEGTKPDVWVIYAGKLGPTKHFEHTSTCAVTVTGQDPLCFEPGLNIYTAAEWAPYEGHKPVADRKESKELEVLEGHELSGSRIAALAKVTTNPDALAALLKMETDKPRIGAPAIRQDPVTIDRLERKLARAANTRPIDLSGIGQIAATRAQIAAQAAKPKQASAAG